jgi:hypothetical protein
VLDVDDTFDRVHGGQHYACSTRSMTITASVHGTPYIANVDSRIPWLHCSHADRKNWPRRFYIPGLVTESLQAN